MRESEIEKYGCQKFRNVLGAEVRKLKWLDRNGAPDRFVLVGGDIFFVEFKATGEKPTAVQLREIGKLRKKGATVLVIDSKELVDRFVFWYQHGRHKPGAPTVEQVTQLYKALGRNAVESIVEELV